MMRNISKNIKNLKAIFALHFGTAQEKTVAEMDMDLSRPTTELNR